MQRELAERTEASSPRSITLESLLDAQGPKEYSRNNGGKRKIPDSGDYVLHPVPPTKQPRGRMSRAKEACLELIAILLQQDVNGFFHFAPKKRDDFFTGLSLRGLERYIHTNKVKSLGHLREYVEELFGSYQQAHFFSTAITPLQGSTAVMAEAARLVVLARRWFESIGEDSDLMHESLYGSIADNDVPGVTSLGLLNPDNRGLVSATEHVRTIGEEVGKLAFGTHLSQNGGYREDRRNRVIPYTYLNYGPYASFGPTFDSGASNCSPEANQLLLSTSWLPARMLFSLEARGNGVKYPDVEEREEECPWSHLRCVAEAEGDAELQAALADCVAEWKEAREASRTLESIIPPVICGDHPDGDFGLYLANAITRNLPKVLEETETKPSLATGASDTVFGQASEVGNERDKTKKSEEPTNGGGEANATLLDESARLLRDLYNSQYRRLGDFSTSALTEERSLRPCRHELHTATRLVGTLVNLVGRLTRGPGDLLTSREPVRRALGLDPSTPVLTSNEAINMFPE